jgi:hypothetical protein
MYSTLEYKYLMDVVLEVVPTLKQPLFALSCVPSDVLGSNVT